MPRISVLPEHIASQIAAGEVVERPSSVVKELVENAIDAGATRIVVDVSEGCRHIRVADNGSGMEADDASLAFQRHATSKLSTADDLWNLGTLGFRGEALPSIAAVSKLTCYTRTENQEIGTKVSCADGAITISETGCAKGTIIEVEDLFLQCAGTAKVFKRPATEFAHIDEIIQSLAITYPQIAFQLSLDGKTRMVTNGSGNIDEALRTSGFIVGAKFMSPGSVASDNNFIPLSARDGVLGLELEGRLASAISFRGDRKGILTIVNGRPVRCGLTYKALDYAYADLIPRGRYPLAVVHLKINPAELDINIHPTKKEIRYAKGNEVYMFLQRQIAHALRMARNIHANGVDSVGAGVSPPAENIDFTPEVIHKPSITYAPEISKQLLLRESSSSAVPALNRIDNEEPVGAKFTSPFEAATFENRYASDKPMLYEEPRRGESNEPATPTPTLPLDWRIAGYIGNTYILLETKSGLSLVEQHIAHERVLYEQLLARTDHSPDSQNIIISLPLNLTNEQQSVLKDHISELATQGFEFEIDGEKISCSQVPIELAHKDYAKIIQTMLQELAESSSANPQLEIVKSLACQSAIKNGMPMAPQQIVELLNLWYAAPRNETCPHGRPIQIDFSYDKLFQLFHPM